MSRRLPPNKSLSRSFIVRGNLAPGTSVGDGTTLRQVIPIGDALRGKVRAKLSAAGGSLAIKYVHPPTAGGDELAEDGTDVHATAAATALSLTDTSEQESAGIDFYGEAALLLEYTDDGGGGGSVIEKIVVSLAG